MTKEEASGLLRETPDWELCDDASRIARTYKVGDFGDHQDDHYHNHHVHPTGDRACACDDGWNQLAPSRNSSAVHGPHSGKKRSGYSRPACNYRALG